MASGKPEVSSRMRCNHRMTRSAEWCMYDMSKNDVPCRCDDGYSSKAEYQRQQQVSTEPEKSGDAAMQLCDDVAGSNKVWRSRRDRFCCKLVAFASNRRFHWKSRAWWRQEGYPNSNTKKDDGRMIFCGYRKYEQEKTRTGLPSKVVANRVQVAAERRIRSGQQAATATSTGESVGLSAVGFERGSETG